MPTVFTHAVVGLGMARLATSRPMPPLYWALSAGLAMLPDLDVIGFYAGIPYGSRFGHRGFAHSLFCALSVGLLTALLTFASLGVRWWLLWIFFFAVMASHGILDAFTNGGMGIALLSPFDDTRYFFAWRPVQVSMIGFGFFSRWGVHALISEIVWIWIPTVAVVGSMEVFRAFAS